MKAEKCTCKIRKKISGRVYLFINFRVHRGLNGVGTCKECQKKQKLKNNKRQRKRRKTDINFKLRLFMSQAVQRVYRLIGTKKEQKTIELLGYSPRQLKKRLEFNFTKQMNWKNYGSCWEIDHKIPVTYFIKKGVKDQKIINALSNLQPLTCTENRKKKDRLPKKALF